VSSDHHLFPSLKQNLPSSELKGDCELETVVTRWQIMQKTGFRQQRTDDMINVFEVMAGDCVEKE
jgi:hypothetical protein